MRLTGQCTEIWRDLARLGGDSHFLCSRPWLQHPGSVVQPEVIPDGGGGSSLIHGVEM
jgi:hypothetical protein